jgi:tRNA threonylcarbamoyladenosine biosynthesis protein TsaE
MEVEPGIVAIEWADRLLYQPANYLKIRLTPALEEGRQVEFLPVGDMPPDWLTAVKTLA